MFCSVNVELDKYERMLVERERKANYEKTISMICDTLTNASSLWMGDEILIDDDEKVATEVLEIIKFRHPAIYISIKQRLKWRAEVEARKYAKQMEDEE